MLSSEQESALHRLCDVFLEENSKLNLSAFRTQGHCWAGNILDSVAVMNLPEFAEAPAGTTLLDIGTGGGFPLLPIAICKPDMLCTGLDSTQKKIDAIGRIADTLQLDNVRLLCGRTEEAGREPDHREQYDIVTARALAPLNTLLEYASPFLKPGGLLIAWKSTQLEQELQDSLLARAELSCQLEDSYIYELPDNWGKRQLLLFRKRAPIAKKYPRAVGIPKKTPLL